MRFTNAVCPYPVCAASRASLLSGLYPHTHGVINNTDLLDWRTRTVAHHFSDAGYHTGLIGKMHFNDGHTHGFHYFLGFNDWFMYLGPKVQAYARKYGLDARDLIVRLCAEDQVEAPDSLLQSLSQELAAQRMPRVVSVRVFNRSRPRPERGAEAIDVVLNEMHSLAVKTGKFSALNVVIGEELLEEFRVSVNIQNACAHVIGSATLTSEEQLASVLTATPWTRF